MDLGSATSAGGGRLVNKPTFVEYANYRFLIMDAPTDAVLPLYLDVLQKRHVKCIVRACESTYATEILTRAGIAVVDLPFTDGEPPPNDVIDKWLDLVHKTFLTGNGNGNGGGNSSGKKGSSHVDGNGNSNVNGNGNDDGREHKQEREGHSGADHRTALAVHCVAGLGRAPMLVAIAFIEAGMPFANAVKLIRSKRRGAFNTKQLKFLRTYNPKAAPGCCVIA